MTEEDDHGFSDSEVEDILGEVLPQEPAVQIREEPYDGEHIINVKPRAKPKEKLKKDSVMPT